MTRVQVEEFYNDNSNQFSAYESRNISHILVESNADAKNVLGRLRKGESFSNLAVNIQLIHQRIKVDNWDGLEKSSWYLNLLMPHIN